MKTTFPTKEEFVIQVLTNGLARASAAFSQIINKKVEIFLNPPAIQENNNSDSKVEGEFIYVITTQLIGSIAGKSFLLLPQIMFTEIANTIGSKHSQEVKDGFIMEIDNIISATVISSLSNEFEKQVYGDVPKLFKVDVRDLDVFIHHHSSDYSALHFNAKISIDQFENGGKFIWILDSKIIEFVPNEKLVA